LTINDTRQLQTISDTNAILKSYDIIAVRTINEKIFYSLCLENDVVDIICFDLKDKLPIKLKRGPVTEAIKKGIMFEITYSPAIEDATVRRMVFSNVISIMNSTKSKNILMTSGCEDPFYHRSPHDIISLSTIFGISKENAVKCVSENAIRCIKRANFRKNFKGIISYATADEEKLFLQKKLNCEVKKKVKPNPKPEEEKNQIEIEVLNNAESNSVDQNLDNKNPGNQNLDHLNLDNKTQQNHDDIIVEIKE